MNRRNLFKMVVGAAASIALGLSAKNKIENSQIIAVEEWGKTLDETVFTLDFGNGETETGTLESFKRKGWTLCDGGAV